MIIDSPIISGSYAASGSLNQFGNVVISGSLTVTGSIIGTASFASTASYLSGYVSPFPFTGSAIISGSLAVTGSILQSGSFTSTGTLTAQTLVVQTVSSSVIYSSGSNVFGNDLANTQVLTGSVSITGSLAVNGSNAILTNQTSSMSASYALNATSASYAANATTASYAANATSASYANNANSASYALTASFSLNVPVTSSYANNANSASYADTASFVTTAQTASFVTLAQTASFVTTAQTASFVITAQTASFVTTAQTASFVQNAVSSSFATTASFALNGGGGGVGFPFSGSAVITGSLLISNLSGSGVRYLVADDSGSITAQSASAALKSTQAFTSTAGQTTFSVTNGYSTGYVDVFINGSKLATAEFTDTSGTNIVLATGSFINDTVEVVKYTPALGVTNNVLRQLTTFTASAAQTVFSASYTPGLLDIFYNGSRLSPADFTANNGTFFTLATGSAANDILDVLVYSYQVGAFSGIGGVGTADQIAFFGTTNSITGSPNFTISGSTMLITGSLTISGSSTFTNIGPAVFSGSITSTAGFTGSFSGTATSASYAANADLLDGLDSTVFTLTSSFAAQTASFTAFTSSILSYTASQNILNGTYATTGSNTFTDIQTVNSNLIVTGSITAQTLVVQTITSSVDFVTGSTRFGSILGNTHVFSGSVSMNPGGLFVSSSGLVGIGTTNPAGLLHISGAQAGVSGKNLTISYNSTYYAEYTEKSITAFNNELIFGTGTGGAERMRILSGGNIGIGSTAPDAKLTIVGGSSAASGYGNLIVKNTSEAGISFGASSTTYAWIQGNVYGSGTAIVALNPQGGNVGIGTTNPTGNLTVKTGTNFNLRVDSYLSATCIASVNDAASAYAMFNIDGNVVRIQGLNTGGNVCIGTTTDFGYKLNLNGQPGANGYTAWTNWSDSRLKENITDLDAPNILNRICTIRPVTYNYNELSGFDEATRARRISGFIAQELMEIFPDMVNTMKRDDDNEYYDTNLSNLNLYLVKAIQEQQTLITALQEKLERNNIN